MSAAMIMRSQTQDGWMDVSTNLQIGILNFKWRDVVPFQAGARKLFFILSCLESRISY